MANVVFVLCTKSKF